MHCLVVKTIFNAKFAGTQHKQSVKIQGDTPKMLQTTRKWGTMSKFLSSPLTLGPSLLSDLSLSVRVSLFSEVRCRNRPFLWFPGLATRSPVFMWTRAHYVKKHMLAARAWPKTSRAIHKLPIFKCLKHLSYAVSGMKTSSRLGCTRPFPRVNLFRMVHNYPFFFA